MATAANALLAAELFRRAAGTPDVEYGLEIEIRVKAAEVPVTGYDVYRPRALGSLSTPRIPIPRYSVAARDEFRKVWSFIEQDFWHASGVDYGAAAFSVDFGRTFRELGIAADAAGS